jgi:hypothetical protein
MSQLSTFFPTAISATSLGLGTSANVTFGSVTTGAINASGGAFTTLAANNGTLTASAPVLDLGQTWNASGTTFTGLSLAITNTASASASAYLSFALGGTQAFSIRRGETNANATIITCGGAGGLTWTARTRTGGGVGVNFSGVVGVGSSLQFGTGTSTGSGDIAISREAANILAQSNGLNAQEFRLYNTFTSSTNHERGFLKWSSNVFQIGTEKGSGGGTARALEFQTDGVTRLTIGTTGESTFASGGAVVITNTTASSSDTTGALRVSGGIATIGDINARNAVRSLNLQLYNTNSTVVWQARNVTLSSPANGIIDQSSATTPQAFRLFKTVSGTGGVNFERANLRWDGDEFIIDAAAGGTGTLRGIKIGSATSSLLGFYGVTPVDQPATVADPAGGGTVDTEARTAVNAIIDRLQELGLIA